MAQMIPPQCDEGTRSGAERRFFNLLKLDPDTDGWVVLHSLGLARSATGPYGEIDFVVLVPTGAVISIEVKGGRVACRDGVWTTTDRFGRVSVLKKSPFMQARTGMFSLRDAIQKRFGDDDPCSRCLYAYAVVFPDVPIPPRTLEFEPWEAIGRDDLSEPVSISILRIVKAQIRKLRHAPLPKPAKNIKRIRQFLRPDFERLVARATTISRSEGSLISLTEDQYEVLDMIAENSRCLVEGAAGTGKTLLALEYARRACYSGERTILLCFNRLLGEWLANRSAGSEQDKLLAGSYFRMLRKLVQKSAYWEEFETQEQESGSQAIFSELLPFYGLLAAEDIEQQYDTVVVDEAQDLLRADVLEVIGALLKGGMAGGKWCFLGDFMRQSIYGLVSRDEQLSLLQKHCPHFSRLRLLTNCRNTRRIGEETALLSGFTSPPYRLGKVDGLPVDYRYWRTQDDQKKKLNEVIMQLLGDGLQPTDIVILSPKKFADSVASTIGIQSDFSVHELRGGSFHRSKKSIAFATVQAFKGMESATIVLCDIDRIASEEPEALLYTGMSRARSYLVVLIHEQIRQDISRALMRKLSQDWRV